MKTTHDLIVIGGGSAGLTAVSFASQLGLRVGLVEKRRVGGDCTWTGCVPSKTLLKAAKLAHEMRQAHRHGLTAVEPAIDLKSVMGHVREVIAEIYSAESAGRDFYPAMVRPLRARWPRSLNGKAMETPPAKSS